MIKTTINIEGMMCGMCEKHMNDAISEGFTVQEVTSSREENQTVVISEGSLDSDKVKQIVADTGFEFKGISEETI
ncbi:MAG: heavy metal-associated domain-containing protein [Firmicutes bacterium]|nr:heavy metal-associated domain-containing protein [Bacillota bacterium]